MTTNILKEGTATVTGAASGIGRATAIAFARDGCRKLALGDIALPGLEETKQWILKDYPDTQIYTSFLDVTDEESVLNFYGTTVTTFGRIDFAANVAGYAAQAGLITVAGTEEQFNRSYEVNQKGLWLCQRSEIRQMLKQDALPGFESHGSIVNVTSLCATIAMPGISAYTGSKAGAFGLTKVDALDYGPQKIRVNSVGPGNVITPMLKAAMGEGHITKYAASTPLRRLGDPVDIANAIVWLSSPRASYITGITLPVDGGLGMATGPP